MTALDRVLKHAEFDDAVRLAGAANEDTAGELVRAAVSSLTEIRAYLAGDDDDGEDEEKGGSDHSSHPTFKAMKKRGVDDAKASSMCAKADKRVKASRQADAALACLSVLGTPDGDWVQATSHDLLGAQVPYADPGWRGRKHLPLDSPEHTRLSLAYVNLAGYAGPELETARERAVAAARGFGIAVPDDDDRVAAAALLELSEHRTKVTGLEEAAELVTLARKQPAGDGGIIMNHGPHTGTHSHGHFQSAVHDHEHQHFGDNSHDGGPAHRNGSKPGGRAGW